MLLSISRGCSNVQILSEEDHSWITMSSATSSELIPVLKKFVHQLFINALAEQAVSNVSQSYQLVYFNIHPSYSVAVPRER